MLTFLDSYVPLDWEKSPCHSGGRRRGGGMGRLIIFDCHVILLCGEFIPALTQKASIGMYSVCDYPHKSYLCIFAFNSIPTSCFNFIAFYTSVLLCNLSMPSDMIFPSTPKFTVMVQYMAYR